MASPESPSPKPDKLATGLIIEAPFLPQIVGPSMMNTHLTSTLLEAPVDSVTRYDIGGPGVLLGSVYTAGAAEKKTEHHYTPPDVRVLIASLEEKRAKLAEARAAAEDPLLCSQLDQAIGETDESLEALRAGQPPAPALARTTFHESSGGEVSVNGEILYEYEGPNIIKATTTTETDESPPNVQVAEKTFEYNPMGRLAEMIEANSPTTYEYDPGGRVISASGEFTSPEGDFKIAHRTLYAYAPPQGMGPTPGNALMASVNESRSGPGEVMRRDADAAPISAATDDGDDSLTATPVAPSPEQLVMVGNPGLPVAKGLDPTQPKVEVTTVLNTYVYA
jgi:YD repeat-containing protein